MHTPKYIQTQHFESDPKTDLFYDKMVAKFALNKHSFQRYGTRFYGALNKATVAPYQKEAKSSVLIKLQIQKTFNLEKKNE